MNNLFLSSEYDTTTNNVVQSIPSSATNNVVQFKVNPLQAIKAAKSLGKDITESYSKNNNGKKSKTLTASERQENRAVERQYLFSLKQTASELLTGERVSYCHNCRADFQKNVFI